MRIFLSHASEAAAVAESIELALSGEGHDVFLDRSDLPSGEAYNHRIREAVLQSDLFIFLISPESVTPGRYTLTELDIAKSAWKHPSGHVLPVVVTPTDPKLIPAYLKAVTLLQPQGNVPAAVAGAVARIHRPWYRASRWRAAAVVIALLALSAALWRGLERRGTTKEVSGLLQAAEAARGSGRFSAAWDVYARAETRARDHHDVVRGRERLAMAWLDNIRVTAGKDTFTSIVDIVEPVLRACAASAERQRAADCRAHLGWGDFLRTREGAGGLSPVQHYRQALELDPGNAYAHAMSAFEINRNRGAIELSRGHSQAALASGRERSYVRHLQIAGLLWRRDAEGDRELVCVVNAMRTHDGSLQANPVISADRWRLWNIYYMQEMQVSGPGKFIDALSAADHLATFEWVFPQAEIPTDKRNLYLFMLGGFQERAGDRTAALATMRALHGILARDGSLASGGRLSDRTVAAVKRLSS